MGSAVTCSPAKTRGADPEARKLVLERGGTIIELETHVPRDVSATMES